MSNEVILLEVEARDKASAVFKSIDGNLGSFSKTIDTFRAALGRSGTDMDAARAKAAALGRSHTEAAAAVKAAQADMVAAGAKVEEAQKRLSAAAKLSGEDQKKASEAAALAMQKASGDEQAALSALQGAMKDSTQKHKDLTEAQKEVGKSSQAAGALMKGVGIGAGAIGVGVGLAALDSLKAAGDFQESMTALMTGAGESKGNIGLVSDGILQLARDTGSASADLSNGMYMIESAGFHGADGLAVLKASAEGAKVGSADLKTVADSVTSGLNDYGMGASGATAMTNEMIATVAAGKMHMNDLAGSLSAVLPKAAAAGLSFDQIGGAVATMTGQGMSAQQATQDLANSIQAIQSPNSVAVQEMEQMGLNASQVSADLGKQGLTGTMAELSQAVAAHMGPAGLVVQNAFNQSQNAAADAKTMFDKLPPSVQQVAKGFVDGTISQKDWMTALKAMSPEQANLAKEFAATSNKADGFNQLLKSGNPAAQTFAGAMGKMLGGATGLNTGLMLTGKHAAVFQDNVKAVGDAAKGAGGDVTGWAAVQEDFNTKLDKAKQGFETVKIAIGTALLPVFSELMDKVSGFLGPIVDWISHNKELAAGILIGTGLVFGLVGAVAALVVVFGFLAANPVVLIISGIIIAVVALGVGIYMLVTHWSQVWAWITQITGGFLNWLKQVWDGFVTWLMTILTPIGGFFASVWAGVVAVTKAVVDSIVAYFKPFVDFIKAAIGPVTAVFKAIWDGIVTGAKTFVAVIATAVITPIYILVRLLGDMFSWLWKNAIKPAWDGIVDVMKVAWNWILSNIINPIVNYVKLVGSVYTWLWQNVLVPVWNGIVDVFRTSWNWILTNVVQPIIDWFHRLADTFTWFWQNVVVPVWNGIRDAISTAWNWLVSNVIRGIQLEIKAVGDLFNWLHDNVIKPVWQGIQDAIGAAWNWLTANVFDPIGKTVDNIGKSFDLMGQGIKKAWDGIMDAAKVPVKFVVDQVYNQGIMPVWNSVAKTVGLGPLDTVNLSFATGGTVPGYSPGNDIVHAMLSPGEGILVPQAVRALGGSAGIDAINSTFGHGGGPSMKGGRQAFGDGGVVGDILGSIGNAVGGALNGLKDAALGGLRALATPVVQGIEHLADGSLGSIGFGALMDSGVHKIGDGFLSFLGGKDGAAAKAGGAAIGSPGAVSGDLAQWVAQAMSDAGITGGDWLNGLETIAMHESGGDPNSQNNWDSNAAAGDPSRGLMQTIGSTFEAYRSASLPDNIFDPVANIVAGIGYIKSRYGGIGNVPGLVSMANGGPYVGYDSGGWLQPGITHVYNGTGKPERVISPDGAGPGEGGGVVNHIKIEISGIGGTLDNDAYVRKLVDVIGREIATRTLPMAGVMIRR